jgi:hypothetical protein
MKRPSYRAAIDWICLNDMPESMKDDGHISSCLVADLFGVGVEKVIRDAYNAQGERIKERQGQ